MFAENFLGLDPGNGKECHAELVRKIQDGVGHLTGLHAVWTLGRSGHIFLPGFVVLFLKFSCKYFLVFSKYCFLKFSVKCLENIFGNLFRNIFGNPLGIGS